MGQHQNNRTATSIISANWDTLRIAHFDAAGDIINLAGKEKIARDAQEHQLTNDQALPPAFTTLEAAEDFAQRVISGYRDNNMIRPCITGQLIEEKQYQGSTLYLPFVSVLPSPHAPGQPEWHETLRVAKVIGAALGQSTDELSQYDGSYDTGRRCGRVMVNIQGCFQGIIFVGGNSLNVLFAPGRVWALTKDGRTVGFGTK
jgi:hypothetical protein